MPLDLPDDLLRLRQEELERLWHDEGLIDAVQERGRFGYCEWDFALRRTIACTRQFARIYGMSIDELLAAQSSWEGVLQQIHVDDRELYVSEYERHDIDSSYEIEYRIYRRDGEVRHVRETGVQIRGSEPGESAAIGLVQDITEQKQHEQELENRFALTRQVEAITDIGHFIWDFEDSNYSYISPGFARIHGSTVDEYRARIRGEGDDIADIHEDDRARVRKLYLAQARSREDLATEYRLIRADGEVRWISEQSTVLWDETLRRDQLVGVLQDITERKTTERALLEAKTALESQVASRTRMLADTIGDLHQEIAEREKVSSELERRNAELERFAYTVSHDLKTPLVTIKGFIGLLAKDIEAGDPGKVASDLEKIGSAADIMGRLLDGLLELSRIGHVMAPAQPCDLNEIVSRAVVLFETEIDGRGIELVVDDGLPTVMGDAIRLVEVYSNLLDNAIKFSGDGSPGRIQVGATVKDAMVECFVLDNGLGLETAYHQQVFALFEKLDADLEGTGVGLALVKRIVEAHGGKIWVESEGEGHGATFRFTLPAV